MKMTKKKASVFGLAATTLFCVGGFSGCVYGPGVEPQATVYGPPAYFEPEGDEGFVPSAAPITSAWKIESWTTSDGETGSPQDGDDESSLPHFSTDDGESFSLSVSGEKEYHGEIISCPDGTYQLKNGDNPNILVAVIEDRWLTITIPSGATLTFVTEEE